MAKRRDTLGSLEPTKPQTGRERQDTTPEPGEGRTYTTRPPRPGAMPPEWTLSPTPANPTAVATPYTLRGQGPTEKQPSLGGSEVYREGQTPSDVPEPGEGRTYTTHPPRGGFQEVTPATSIQAPTAADRQAMLNKWAGV